VKEKSRAMMKYKCNVCGFIYDPKDGDSMSGILPNTPFENLPEDWVCPVCQAGKEEFTPTR
jgi:rubredoxin